MVNATQFPYNLDNVTNSVNIVDFVREVNHLTGDYFMLGMLLAGFVILFVASKKANVEPKESLAASTFIIAVISISFFAMEFITTAMLTLLLIGFGLVFMYTVLKP